MVAQENEATATKEELQGIAQRFLQVMKQRGWATQVDMAQNLGVHERTVSSVCTADRMIGSRMLLGMLRQNLDVGYILTGKQETPDSMVVAELAQRVAVLEATLKSILLIGEQVFPPGKAAAAKNRPPEPEKPQFSAEQLQLITRYESAPAHIKSALDSLYGCLEPNETAGAGKTA